MKCYIIVKGPLYFSGKSQTIENVERPIMVKFKKEAKFYKNRKTTDRKVKDLNTLLKPETKYQVKEVNKTFIKNRG